VRSASPSPAAKLMSDWHRIQKRDQGRAAGALINPVAVKPLRDHMKANLQGLREKAKQVRDQRQEAAAPQKPAFKMKEFQGVGGKVQQNLPQRNPDRPVEFLKAGEGKMAQPVVEPRVEPRQAKGMARPEVPRAEEMPPPPKHEAKNHILVNRICAQAYGEERRAPGPAADPTADRIKKNFGKVPTYLKGIKGELEDKKRQAELAAQKEDIPPGYRMLDEEERVEMLQALEEKLAEANARYQKLPLRVESDRAKKAQKELETKIDDLDKAVKMFSKPKVILQE